MLIVAVCGEVVGRELSWHTRPSLEDQENLSWIVHPRLKPTVRPHRAKSSYNNTWRVNSKLEADVLMIGRVTSHDDFPIPVSSDWGGGLGGAGLVATLHPSYRRRSGNRDPQTSFGDRLASAFSRYRGILDRGGDGILDRPQDR